MRKYRLSEQTRQYCYEEEHGKQSVTLRQIVALMISLTLKRAAKAAGWMRNALSASRGSAGSTMSTAWSSPGRASVTTPA
ncbi:transferase [Klebsiella pneumoniae]|uniref:Transferase n=1 Tax=Klebsiella pneumoniae TaxID=573 RepID=A0A2X3IXG6_KLEPN|nr:transferase [Klebsiella pneumoniae]